MEFSCERNTHTHRCGRWIVCAYAAVDRLCVRTSAVYCLNSCRMHYLQREIPGATVRYWNCQRKKNWKMFQPHARILSPGNSIFFSLRVRMVDGDTLYASCKLNFSAKKLSFQKIKCMAAVRIHLNACRRIQRQWTFSARKFRFSRQKRMFAASSYIVFTWALEHRHLVTCAKTNSSQKCYFNRLNFMTLMNVRTDVVPALMVSMKMRIWCKCNRIIFRRIELKRSRCEWTQSGKAYEAIRKSFCERKSPIRLWQLISSKNFCATNFKGRYELAKFQNAINILIYDIVLTELVHASP